MSLASIRLGIAPASLAAASRHPLARALVAAAPPVPAREDVVEHPGQGLSAGDLRLGSRIFCGVADRAPDPVSDGLTAILRRIADPLQPNDIPAPELWLTGIRRPPQHR